MEKCLSSERGVLGLGALSYYSRSEFRIIAEKIKNETPSLINETNKSIFRRECLKLIDFLIQNKNAPRYVNQNKWEGTIKNWATSYFKLITKNHGGCFPILDNNEKKILELNYEALDFCENKNNKINEIQCLTRGRKISGECDETCSNKINEYNAWINEKYIHFSTQKVLIQNNCKNPQSQFPTNKCDILNPKTFSKLPECTVKYSVARTQLESAEKKTIPPDPDQTIDSVQSNPQDLQKQDSYIGHVEEEKTEVETEQEQVRQNLEPQTEELPSTKDSSTQGDSREIQDPQPINEQTSGSAIKQRKSSDDTAFSPNTGALEDMIDSKVISSSTSMQYALIGMFKKKKNIKRKQMKFLRIKVPSLFDKKSKFFTNYHLESPIYDDEEIIKKIKINERRKKVNLSKQKKDRSKIIIEVHMEVLEEYRNENWENRKDEFLEICIDEFTKEDNITYPNLKDDDLIIENVKCISDIKKQNILWNKWIQRHRNLSQNLKKDDWFNNLKDEWKREVAYIQEMEEIKKKSSNETQKVSFLEREKDIWRQWISKKGIIIQQYFDQYWNNGLAEELQNISDECVNEDTKNYVSLLNVEELKHKENYEELCKYIKKKLLTKFCILVLIAVLEECKKEVNLENRESYLDRSINEWKGEGYSSKKQEITENIIEYNKNDIENKRNEEFNAHIRKDSFRNEIEDWIREDDLYANSIVSDSTVDKSDEIEDKQFL
ncbi:STP1 protein [Plasmodium malariae]|uniref:STP1 protein n=1 Tax=Plasmodium malariae TaxID=5858 RepID=A0A1D3JHL6_PLAMA|nr:STP1 protein [Plasmodium malariae]SBT85875.1 STP1 protein [Plasmodium malariae]